MRGVWLSLLCLFSACASPADAPPPQALQSASRTDLAPRNLAPGECGLFVWTRSAPRRFIVFSQASKATAVWHDGSAEQPLTLLDATGDAAFDQSPQQQLRRADGTVLTLDMRQPERITQGIRYKAGVLSVTGPEAWEQVVPVVGLASCKAITP